LDHLKSCQR